MHGGMAAFALHGLGGFVVTVLHGLPRPTADIDVLAVVPGAALGDLIELAGESSGLHRKHGVYLDVVTVVTCPDGTRGDWSSSCPAPGAAFGSSRSIRTTSHWRSWSAIYSAIATM